MLKADSHITCRPHAVPLTCRAAEGLECVFPIWFTQCGRDWFTLAMPLRCHPRPCHSSQGHGTAWPSREDLWVNCPRSASSGKHAEFHEGYIRRIRVSDAGGRPGPWARTACSFRHAQAATLLEFMYHSRIVLSVGGPVWYIIRNLRCTVTIDLVLANSKPQNAFLFNVNTIFVHDYPLAVEPGSTPRPLVQKNLESFSTYWYAPFFRVCLGCCAVDFGNPGGTYYNSLFLVSSNHTQVTIQGKTGHVLWLVYDYLEKKIYP